MNKKYKAIPQNGELSYGQPGWGVRPTSEELSKVASYHLTIESRPYTTTTKWDDETEPYHTYAGIREVKCVMQDGLIAVRPQTYKEVAACANYFGDRLGENFYEHWGFALIEQKVGQ